MRWTRVLFYDTCDKCKATVQPGDSAIIDLKSSLICEACGREMQADGLPVYGVPAKDREKQAEGDK